MKKLKCRDCDQDAVWVVAGGEVTCDEHCTLTGTQKFLQKYILMPIVDLICYFVKDAK